MYTAFFGRNVALPGLWPDREPTKYHTRDKHANHYTTDVLFFVSEKSDKGNKSVHS